MGASSYSSSVFDSTIGRAVAAGIDTFSYSADVSSGKVATAVHPTLDPKLVAGPKSPHAGKVMRESRDSDAHLNSVAISVLFDVTGSMGSGPRKFVEKLGPLMGLIIKKGYLADPQIMFGAIGDETSDNVPLQIGQYESGNEMDASLTNIYIEGGGGGQHYESYELAFYFMARHTSADCWEKRGKKGYLFIVGDECFRAKVSKGAIKRIVGDEVTEDLSTESVLEELREKYEVIWIFPNCSGYYNDTLTAGPLSKEFGQNFIRLEKVEEIAELIAATIGIAEGYDPKDVTTALIDAGMSKAAAGRVTTALAVAGATTTLTKKAATVEGDLVVSGKDSVDRL
jgi:hypothetical protein